MIRTAIFLCDNYDDVKDLNGAISIVNDFITTNHITKTDIMEYHTEIIPFEVNEVQYSRYRITLSYWVNV